MRNVRFRCTSIARYDALSGGASGAMRWRVFITGLVLATTGGDGFCHADCAALYTLAQRHAHDMARRNSLDHAGFKRLRGPAGCCRECRGRMRNRGLCKTHVDAVAAAPREHDARRVPGSEFGNNRWRICDPAPACFFQIGVPPRPWESVARARANSSGRLYIALIA